MGMDFHRDSNLVRPLSEKEVNFEHDAGGENEEDSLDTLRKGEEEGVVVRGGARYVASECWDSYPCCYHLRRHRHHYLVHVLLGHPAPNLHDCLDLGLYPVLIHIDAG